MTESEPPFTELIDASPAIPADSALPGWLAAIRPELQPYATLARYDRPVGIWLLAIPCWIGLAFERINGGFQWFDLVWIILFGLGAIAMRGAGCTWNDIMDRDLDASVSRTASRPLPSGQIPLSRAWIWLGIQVFAGFLIWLFLPSDARIVALLAIPLVAAYPFMKRLVWWPQAWLGLTFNWGVLIAVATVGSVSLLSVILLFGLVLWTISYDTIYALQDQEDDALIGVKSTARLFGDKAVLASFCFHLGAAAIIALAAWLAGAGRIGALTALAFLAHGIWQTTRLRTGKEAVALPVFKSNVWAGGIIAAGFALAALLSASAPQDAPDDTDRANFLTRILSATDDQP